MIPHNLVVNADDYGAHPDIDSGIHLGIEKGLITSISVIPQSKTLDWTLLKQFQDSGVQIGIHLTLVEFPWLTQPYHLSGWHSFLCYLWVPLFIQKVNVEIEAQIDRFIGNGLTPSHIDSHQHLHVLPGVWPIVFRYTCQLGCSRLRVPFVDNDGSRRLGLPGRALQFLAKRRYMSLGKDKWLSRPCLGLKYSGQYTKERFCEEWIDHDESVDYELIVHPGMNTDDLNHRYSQWGYQWEAELVALETFLLTLKSGSEFQVKEPFCV